MADQKEKKPSFAFYIVNRRLLEQLLAQERAQFGERGANCGEMIREATVTRVRRRQVNGVWMDDPGARSAPAPFYGQSAWHAFCRATHGKGVRIPFIPAYYAVVPAAVWQAIVVDANAALGELDYFPQKVRKAPEAPDVPKAPKAPTRVAKPTSQLSFGFRGDRVRPPMPKKSIFAAPTASRPIEQLTLNFAELDR